MCTRPLAIIHDELLDTFRGSRLIHQKVLSYRDKQFWPRPYRDLLDSEYDVVPCGQCMECRLNRSKAMACRCVLEAKCYEFNYFITFTYSDEYLPETITAFNKETKEEISFHPLVKRDFQNFMKRLRNIIPGVRYKMCGEYGDKNKRPHYHALLFNCPLPDLVENKEFRISKVAESRGGIAYESLLLNNLWNKGIVCVNPFNFDTAAYVCRYITKKQLGIDFKKFNEKMIFYDKNGVIIDFPREYTTQSLKPGIGVPYFDVYKDSIIHDDLISIWTNGRMLRFKPCRLFQERYALEDPFIVEENKKTRKLLAYSSQKLLEEQISNLRDYYCNKSNLVGSRSKRLIRQL